MQHNYDLALPSYAKINLGLKVLAQRPDGYHAIETIFQEIEFHDMLYFRKQPGALTLDSDHPALPLDKDNLVYKAIQLLRDHCRCPDRVHVYIQKNIPLGAGLGGGSSNAAKTLEAMNQLFDLRLSVSELAELSAKLGSDISFFHYGGTALGTGRGEEIYPLPGVPRFWILLVNPRIHVSSAWAYKNINLKLTNSHGLINVFRILKAGHITDFPFRALSNDLEGPVMERYPIVRSIKKQLCEAGAEWAMMSGSGSTVFGIFYKKEFAENALQQLQNPDWMTCLTRMRSGNP
ncbi:4-(cytidine 5'-diphospho)-2-C-methyl-D-erythritol kinase [candidate division KSB3 bacterium]|uniref:4-diphosphocytidyl-2-C-methyl-D-erythritol kinase n=1 Tax=candidate division KSB3 bacterium TaxID=2044937 RepID=A0A2G6E4P0_9BACT|nr:MAG: 4-(cytidine 5'-diphospho)-2-C-methyl-D-erythritol kinase [candidate division KSB3 bacterium]PIE29650.1 MAG: 4-(cytidine 5'-diphospho)-2-C-methyl-D-erythritol kinase [candidate division KSB3 bacterium]